MESQFEHSPPSWWLRAIADLDVVCPGLCGALLRASPHRQHVAATVLAHRRGDELMNGPELVSPLVTSRINVLLVDLIGSNPSGLIGCLRRMSAKIEPPAFYRKLAAIYSDPEQKDVARAFRHVTGLNSTMLNAAIGSPRWLLDARAFRVLANARQRDDLVAAVELIREICPTATSDGLETSLRKATARDAIPGFIQTWLSKSRFPDAPIPLHNDIVHIATASDLHRVATEFENCIDTFRLDILCGREAFYSCDTQGMRVIGRIGRDDSSQAWQFLGVHGRRNVMPPHGANTWVRQQFGKIGIHPEIQRADRPKKWRPIERLLDPWFYDIDDVEDSVVDDLCLV